MPFHRGMSGSVSLLPVVSTDPVQQFNQDRASFVCYVSSNGYAAGVKFQYNTTNNWSSYTEVSAGTVSGQNQMAYFNVTGLSNNTTYYVRAVATTVVGTVTGSVVSFTTWGLKTYLNTSAGSWSLTIPSITPIGGSAIAPTIYEMLVYGGGGSAAYGGGGGGGYRIFASHVSSVVGSQTVSGYVGAGGPYNSSNAQPAPSGENSTITIGTNTWTAGGGTGGGWLTNAAGTAGSGNNPQYGGGVGYYGYTYISGYVQYCCGGTDKFGNCYQSCDDPNQPIYTTDYNRYAGGGGGGTDGGGGNAGYPDVGGNGGPGGGAYGLRGGNGGGGGGTAAWGSAGSVPAVSGPVVGTGGTGWWNAGVAGGITFKYYGP
jgi:hypothetical protein